MTLTIHDAAYRTCNSNVSLKIGESAAMALQTGGML
jgi:hypothetical protein